MSNVSDVIEDFILQALGSNDNVNLSRNELAGFFNCAPSQINYVLSTRFNLNRGFIISSQRGGGGYIKLIRIKDFDNTYIFKVIDNNLNKEMSFKDAVYLLEDLVKKEFLTISEAKILSYAIDDKALTNPIKIDGKIRSNILKNTLINILKERGRENE